MTWVILGNMSAKRNKPTSHSFDFVVVMFKIKKLNLKDLNKDVYHLRLCHSRQYRAIYLVSDFLSCLSLKIDRLLFSNRLKDNRA